MKDEPLLNPIFRENGKVILIYNPVSQETCRNMISNLSFAEKVMRIINPDFLFFHYLRNKDKISGF
jgi:hypothetical protein